MAFPRVTSKEAVLKALAEYDALGAAAFHAKYGFGPALEYFIVVDGKSYDSKAVLAAAQGFEHPDLGPARNDFSGGKAVKAALERIGFEVVRTTGDAGEQPTSASSVGDIHLVVKWSTRYASDTVERHREVVDRHGSVWWGLFTSDESAWRVSEQWVNRLHEQIASGRDTYVFISGASCWRTTLHAVEYERERVNDELIPSYYRDRSGRYHLWVRLSDFVALERDDLLRALDPVAQPGRAVALGNQTNPLIVRVRRAPRVWWVNQGTSFRRAREGGYLWAPVLDKSGRTPDHWQTMRHLRVGDVVLNYANTRLRAWSRVSADATPAPRPDPAADQGWSDDGYRAALEYHDLNASIPLSDIPIEWRQAEGGPFTQDGGVKQGYLFHLSDKFAQQLQQRFPQLAFDSRDIDATPEPFEPADVLPPALDVTAVIAAVEARGLRIADSVISQSVAAIRSGKHVILTGPPGTAKTTLAELIASSAAEAGLSTGYMLTTATADWTTYETIGGLKPDADGGLTFQEGHFLDAIRKNEWLVIDELNRSNFDRAFGQLFTVLSGQAVELPYERMPGAGRVALVPAGAMHGYKAADVLEIPETWRVIATMNVFDKSLLFEMSFALMRRFTFIEVPSPERADFEALIDEQAEGDAIAADVTKKLLGLRALKDLGPAVYIDLARFARERRAVAEVEEGQLAYEAFYGYLLPQFEGIDEIQGERLYKEVKRLVGPQNADRLRQTLTAVLGLESLVEVDSSHEEGEPLVEPDELDVELERPNS